VVVGVGTIRVVVGASVVLGSVLPGAVLATNAVDDAPAPLAGPEADEPAQAASQADIGAMPAPSADHRKTSRLLRFPIAPVWHDGWSRPLTTWPGEARNLGCMARIALPENGNLDIVNALSLVRPELARAVGGYDAAVSSSTLDPRLHEFVRMRIAQINACTVCLAWRTPAAVSAGATEELLGAVERYADVDEFTAAEKVAIEYAERFSTDSANIDDAFIARLGRSFAPADIVELTLVISKYIAFGRFMQVLGLDQSCVLEYAQDGGVQVR
jgi:AhpD family alkylhydroperoxidase